MDAGINNVIYMELYSGPKMANGRCGKTIDTGTIDRGSTVYIYIYIYRVFGGENVKERGYLEDPGIDGMIFKWMLKKQDGETWNEFIWFMIKCGGLL